MSRGSWISGAVTRPDDRLYLVCLPHAGGGAASFTPWRAHLPPGIGLVPVQLPGRETRMAEPMPDTLPDLVGALVDALADVLDRPYALFGHSFGGLVAYEATRELGRRGCRPPVALLLSAARAPHVPPPVRLHQLPDDLLLRHLREIDGIPTAVLRHPEYLALLLRAIRADLRLAEHHDSGPLSPLSVPLHVFAGAHDHAVPPEDVEPWQRYAGAAFSATVHEGDHFAIYAAPASLMAELAGRVLPLVPAG